MRGNAVASSASAWLLALHILVMGSKRNRKAAAAAHRKRVGQANAAARKKAASISNRMDVCDSVSHKNDQSRDAQRKELRSAGCALRTALHGTPRVESVYEAGKRYLSFAASPGMSRLSNEELRIAADSAMKTCDRALDRNLFPRSLTINSFLPENTPYVKCGTPGCSAARIAAITGVAVEANCRNRREADEILRMFKSMRISILSRGDDERNDTYLFIPEYEPKMLRLENNQPFPEFITESADESYFDGCLFEHQSIPNYTPHGAFSTIEPFSLPPTPRKGERRIGGVVNLAGVIDDDDDNENARDDEIDDNETDSQGAYVKDMWAADSNESNDKKDGPGTPSGSSIWSSFGRLFNFGRSPEDGPQQSEGDDEVRTIPPFASPAFVTTSPTTPGNTGNSAESFMTANTSEQQFCQNSSASEEDGVNGVGNGNQKHFRTGSVSIRNGPSRPRRVLRAARTLKQPPSSPSTPDVCAGISDLTTLLAETDIGRNDSAKLNVLPPCVTRTSTNNSSSKRTKKSKVKRRPRVRLCDDDEPENQ